MKRYALYQLICVCPDRIIFSWSAAVVLKRWRMPLMAPLIKKFALERVGGCGCVLGSRLQLSSGRLLRRRSKPSLSFQSFPGHFVGGASSSERRAKACWTIWSAVWRVGSLVPLTLLRLKRAVSLVCIGANILPCVFLALVLKKTRLREALGYQCFSHRYRIVEILVRFGQLKLEVQRGELPLLLPELVMHSLLTQPEE